MILIAEIVMINNHLVYKTKIPVIKGKSQDQECSVLGLCSIKKFAISTRTQVVTWNLQR